MGWSEISGWRLLACFSVSLCAFALLDFRGDMEKNAADTVYMYMHQQYLRTHTHTSGHINIAVTLRGLRVLAKLLSAECVSVLAPDMAIRTKLMYIKDKSYAHKQIHS